MTTLVATRSHIREATIADVPRLVEMACAQLAETYPVDHVPANRATLETFIRQIITTPACAVFVVEQDSAVVGMIGMTLYHHPQSGLMTAGEVAWWMEPEARGHGRALLARAERWALERGAVKIQMTVPATNARVSHLYERRGYRLLESSYQATTTPAMSAIAVHDDVLPYFSAYRADVLAQPFRTVEPHPGAIFHGISEDCSDVLPAWIRAHYPTLTPTLTFARQSPEGQAEPHYIHTDLDMGEWTAILYLNQSFESDCIGPPASDGTTFWRWRETGCIKSLPTTDALAEWAAWRDQSQWDAWTTVQARPNRVILFPAAYFHSRAILENYGTGADARLIQVCFGTGTFPQESRH